MRTFLLLLILITGLSSCRKNKDLSITIEGTVLNRGDGSPASGVTVKIKYQEIGSGSVSTAYQTITSTSTDASGRYSLTFDKPAAAEYKFELSSSRHFSVEYSESADNISAAEVNTRNFSIAPLAWFSIRIRNATPLTIQDQIIYQNTSEQNGCSTCCGNSPITKQGTAVDTTIICKRQGGTKIRFSWSVLKGGNSSTNTDSVLVVPYDTTFYNLDY